MKRDINRIYRQLKFYGLISNQFDYSTHWLGQCNSYFSSMKARDAEPCSNATLALLARLHSYRERLRVIDEPHCNHHFDQMSQMLEQEANLIADHLHEGSLQRVYQRQDNQVEMAI